MRKGQRKKNLTDIECANIVQHILRRCTPKGKIPKGVAVEIGQITKDHLSWGTPTQEGQLGHKRLHDDLSQRIQTIPQSRRYCIRTIAHLLKFPTSTLHCYFKRGVIAKYSTVLKPALTDSNKVCRLNWAIKHVQDVDGA
ncbi:hypothetical protein H310_13632 [Aphanomyces invadans]|uniref:Transposase Tc1-like domain-containing protein n=1 Tax=Aphanomyces invadans TaxID=157072 RepID=A0A024TCW8_9STRA|nr:hypothetical protein H310_13632 [Aphanomyces invadans]ETV92000.1 hypothetical protein H310_13632 [Aphanomyces invadans]|eukprot:XP_008879424.1 hypothetical protein H310_13632 [Aphanomyces invadans]